MKGNPKTLKDALYDTIHRNEKSLGEIAEELDMSASYLARAALPDSDMLGKDDPSATGVRFPLKKLVPLIRATGDRQVLDYIAHSVDCFVVDIPRKVADLEAVQLESITAAAEFGDMMREISTSSKDSRLSRSERERIHKEGWEAIQAIFRVIIGCEEGQTCRR